MNRRAFITGLGYVLLTGSRAFGVATRHSDYDYMREDEPPSGSGWAMVEYAFEDGYLVYRKGNVNLIVIQSQEKVRRWEAAHSHCRIEKPRSKDRRKVIFDHYMYGTPLGAKQPVPKAERYRWAGKRG